MKRWILLAAVAVVLSTAATVAVQYMGAATAPAGPSFPVNTAGAKAGPQPKAVLEGDETYYFGTLPQRTTGKHTWVVRNEGDANLELWMVSSTCSCTLAKFKNGEKAVVPPHETTEITLEYETRENNGTYEKGAEIGTNAPNLPRFSLLVKGQVFPAVQTFPPGGAVNFSTISNDKDDNKTYLAVFSKDKPDMKITDVTTSKPDLVTVDLEPLPPREAKEVMGVEKGGYKATIHIKSGLPLGTIREEIVFKTDHPQEPEFRIPVVGRMTGPVTLMPSALVLHQVNGKTGGQGELIISVVNGRETAFTVEKAPEGLDVSVKPIAKTKGRYRLKVVVPPGTPAREIEGDIVLGTDHPKAATVTAPVSIWVQSTR